MIVPLLLCFSLVCETIKGEGKMETCSFLYINMCRHSYIIHLFFANVAYFSP